VLESRVARRIFGPKRQEVTGWRKFTFLAFFSDNFVENLNNKMSLQMLHSHRPIQTTNQSVEISRTE
jgi:hypothetical protein